MPRPELPQPTRFAGLAALLVGLAVSGCGAATGLLGRKTPAPAPVVSQAESSRALLDWLEGVRAASPAARAELIGAARTDWEQRKSLEGRLRLGLALANPELPGADALAARQHLGEVLAHGDLLPPDSRVIAQWSVAALDARLALQSENLRLQTEGAQRDRDRTLALTRRLQQELDENNRLRRALDEAQKKLAAIIELERGNTSTSPAVATPAPVARPVKKP